MSTTVRLKWQFVLACFLFLAPCTSSIPLAQEYHSRGCPGSTGCFSYAFVDANVTVKSPVRKRVKVTSPVFSFCGLETTPDKIAHDAQPQVAQDVRSRYGSDFEITYLFVTGKDTREQTEEYRAKEMKNSEYSEYIESRYLYVVYSGKCHN